MRAGDDDDGPPRGVTEAGAPGLIPGPVSPVAPKLARTLLALLVAGKMIGTGLPIVLALDVGCGSARREHEQHETMQPQGAPLRGDLRPRALNLSPKLTPTEEP